MHNPRLRSAIDKVLDVNMTRATIESRHSTRRRGTRAHTTMNTYEGYGPGGIAVMVDCQTDNQT